MRDKTKVKPGDIFLARPDQVPKAFRDVLKPLEKFPTEKEPVVFKTEYTLQKRAGTNWYDIVDSKGKVLNTKALKRIEALEFKASLEG